VVNGEHQTGQNWIQLAATLPRQNPLTVPKVKMHNQWFVYVPSNVKQFRSTQT